jgi:hypothetical protein
MTVPVGIWAGPSGAAERTELLPAARDFHADAADAAASGRPLLVLFSQDGCLWCERTRREFLLPMQRNPDYRAKVIFRQVDTDHATPLTGFDGGTTSHSAFARALKVRLFPTVMLLDANGRVLAEPLVGFGIADFYGAYLDGRINVAIASIARGPASSAAATATLRAPRSDAR